MGQADRVGVNWCPQGKNMVQKERMTRKRHRSVVPRVGPWWTIQAAGGWPVMVHRAIGFLNGM